MSSPIETPSPSTTETAAASTSSSPQVRTAPARGFFRSPAFKFFLIGFITLALLVPLFLVWGLAGERENRAETVKWDIAREWGGGQTLFGPALVVPFTVRRVEGTGASTRAVMERRTAVFLPDDLSLEATTTSDIRRVSIYETPVYTADVIAEARFGGLDLSVFGPSATVDWAEASLLIGFGDLKGLESVTMAVGGAPLTVGPVADGLQAWPAALASDLPPAAAQALSSGNAGLQANVSLRLRGTDRLMATPVGRMSEIRFASDWPHPSFAVGALPSEREVRPDGFSATWRIPYLARGFPQAFVLEADPSRLSGTAVGAAFAQPVNFYALVDRALKYGLMFIASVLGVVFVLEMLSPARIHPVQYTLVGLILVFFYVVLLAFAEQVGFGFAYAIAASATTAVIAAFVGLALGKMARAVFAAAALGAIFGVLHMILRLEDVALLAGACVGFLALSAALFATRRVDWSGQGSVLPPPRPA